MDVEFQEAPGGVEVVEQRRQDALVFRFQRDQRNQRADAFKLVQKTHSLTRRVRGQSTLFDRICSRQDGVTWGDSQTQS